MCCAKFGNCLHRPALLLPFTPLPDLQVLQGKACFSCVILPVDMSAYIFPDVMMSYYRFEVLCINVVQIKICCQNNGMLDSEVPCLPADFYSHYVFCNTSSQR